MGAALGTAAAVYACKGKSTVPTQASESGSSSEDSSAPKNSAPKKSKKAAVTTGIKAPTKKSDGYQTWMLLSIAGALILALGVVVVCCRKSSVEIEVVPLKKLPQGCPLRKLAKAKSGPYPRNDGKLCDDLV